MRFFKWLSSVFGRAKDADPRPNPNPNAQHCAPPPPDHWNRNQEEEEDERGQEHGNATAAASVEPEHNSYRPVVGRGGANGGHRRGFSMPVYMPADKPHLEPLLVECPYKNGGVQGLDWCGQLLLMDEDGDVAHEFYEEKILPSPPPPWPREEECSMSLGNHIAIEKEKQLQRKMDQGQQGFVKVNRSTVRPANVRRVDLREGLVRYLIQDSDRKCHWA